MTSRGALSHVRVCDFTGQLAGAGATRWLAAFGADVIRIEDPINEGRWDILRGASPYIDERRGIELGGGFNNHNVGKRGITLNLREDRAKKLLAELIRASDVVAENFAFGVLERWGFGYEQLRSIRPDIIYVSNCGFGRQGPYREFRTWGPTVQACCGLAFYSGLPDEPPAGWGYSYMDHLGAYFQALAILCGLVHRDRTGEGQWIDMSCTEAGATLLGPVLLDVTANGRPSRRDGSPDTNHSQFPLMVPHGIYPCAGDDEWVAISCRDDVDWRAFAQLLGEPGDAGLDERHIHEAELDATIAAWTRSRDKFDVEARLQAVGVAAAAVQKPSERIDHDANTAAWGLWPEVEHPVIGSVRVDGIPVHLSETDWVIDRAAPCLGQHTDEVLSEVLRLTTEEIEDLHEKGIV
jgi:benzylsuccinate CoA-transferase BbsF subunit